MRKRPIRTVSAVAAIVVLLTPAAYSQSLSVDIPWTPSSRQTGPLLQSDTDQNFTYDAPAPFRAAWDNPTPYNIPYAARIFRDGTGELLGNGTAYGHQPGQRVFGAGPKLADEVRFDMDGYHPYNFPEIVAEAELTRSAEEFEIDLSDQLFGIPFAKIDVTDHARSAARSIGNSLFEAAITAGAINEFKQASNLPDLEVENRIAQLRNHFLGGLEDLADAGVNVIYERQSGNYITRVVQGDPIKSEVEIVLPQVQHGLLGATSLSEVFDRFDFDFQPNSGALSELYGHGLNYTTGGSLPEWKEHLHDVVTLEHAMASFPITFHESQSTAVTGTLGFGAENISLSRIRGLRYGGGLYLNKMFSDDPNNYLRISLEQFQVLDLQTDDWGDFQQEFKINTSLSF